MTDEWQNTPEDDGITLGPEEALEREIAKSKALKVDRLQLKDRVDRLTAQNQALRDQLEALRQKSGSSSLDSERSSELAHRPSSEASSPASSSLPNRWAFVLLVFNLAAIGLLVLFLLQKPSS